jgi:signal peptidase
MSRPVPVNRAARVAARSGFIALLALAAILIALPLAGYHRYVITGGSMGGTIEKGSVAWAKEVPVEDLEVGDVITYAPPRGAGPHGLVTHRIVAIGRDRNGEREFRTKGDANASADPWTFNLDHATQARVAFHLPYLGYPLAKASDRGARTIVVGFLALLIVGGTFARLWRDAGEALEGSAA